MWVIRRFSSSAWYTSPEISRDACQHQAGVGPLALLHCLQHSISEQSLCLLGCHKQPFGIATQHILSDRRITSESSAAFPAKAGVASRGCLRLAVDFAHPQAPRDLFAQACY